MLCIGPTLPVTAFQGGLSVVWKLRSPPASLTTVSVVGQFILRLVGNHVERQIADL